MAEQQKTYTKPSVMDGDAKAAMIAELEGLTGDEGHDSDLNAAVLKAPTDETAEQVSSDTARDDIDLDDAPEFDEDDDLDDDLDDDDDDQEDDDLDEETDDLEDELDEETDDEDDAQEDDEETDDPKLSKRLAAIKKRQKRDMQRLDAKRAEIEKLHADAVRIQEQNAAELGEWKRAKERAAYDMSGLAMALGVTEPDHLLAAAKQLHAQYKLATGQGTPEEVAAAGRTLQNREMLDKLDRLEKRNAELEKKIDSRDKAEDDAKTVAVYLDKVTSTAKKTKAAPMVRNLLKRNKKKAEQRLAQVAYELLEETGETPDAADVIETLEQLERSALEDRGIDPDRWLRVSKRKAQAREANPVARKKKKRSASLGNDLGKPTKPRSEPTSRREQIDDVRANLLSGKLE